MRRFLAAVLVLSLLYLPVFADELPTQIHTADDLLAIAQNPEGSYILMEDLDMTGIPWPCPDFAGSFDGNGHAILNVSFSQPGQTTAISYDGNVKTYDTYFAGFFSTLKNATVQDLHLVNVQALVEADTPIFLGGLAGYSEHSSVTGCSVSGILELRAHDRMFGVGGLIGYGNGTVDACRVDVTLICTDTDANTRDEQFMGGIFATGYMDVTNCEIVLDGYSSEYGYAHNGGITGMYMQQPLGKGYKGYLTDNTVTGKITFFECNTNRRAYCKADAGEVVASRYTISRNKTDFTRDERKEYDTELRPEMCAAPVYAEEVIASGCDTYGYTCHTCTSCGYTYKDAYTLFSHTVTQWQVVKEPTTQEEGLSQANCDLCGKEFTRSEPVLELPPTTEPTTVPTQPVTQPTAPQQPAEAPQPFPWLWVVIPGCAIVLLCILPAVLPKQKGGKYLKKKTRR